MLLKNDALLNVVNFKLIWKQLFKTLLTPNTYYMEHTTSKSRNIFSYVRMIQSHPPTSVRNSKYLAIPPTLYPYAIIRWSLILLRPFIKTSKDGFRLGRYSFLLGFMMSKKSRRFLISYCNRKFNKQPLMFFSTEGKSIYRTNKLLRPLL